MNEVLDWLFDGNEETRVPRFTPTQIAEAARRSELSDRPKGYAHATACHYWPVPYIPGGVVAQLTLLSTNNLLWAFYAVRIMSWVLMSLFVLWALHALPWARNFLLAFYSIPEVIQQTAALNSEIWLFSGAIALVYLFFKPPTPLRAAGMSLLVVGLTLTKVVLYPLIGFVFPHLWQLRHRFTKARWHAPAAALLAVGLPLAVWKGWYLRVDMLRYLWMPEGVDPGQQKTFLLEHPLQLANIMFTQFFQTFGDEFMLGSWKSVFGALGPSKVPLPGWGYAAILFALAFAVAQDLRGDPLPRPEFDPLPRNLPTQEIFWFFILSGISVGIPATTLAMYLYFTEVGSDFVVGVQGRYYLPPLLLLTLLAVRHFRGRWGRVIALAEHSVARYLPQVAAACGMVAAISGNYAVVSYYWFPH